VLVCARVCFDASGGRTLVNDDDDNDNDAREDATSAEIIIATSRTTIQ